MRNFLEFIPQTDDIDLSRIDRFQKKMSNRVASICSERAVLYTESFKQTEGEPYILRKAKAFAHTLAHMTVYIESDSLIFGNQASSNFAAPVFPEFSIDWVVDELDGTNGAKPTPRPQHIPEIGGSSPPPTTKNPLKSYDFSGFLYYFSARFIFVSAV